MNELPILFSAPMVQALLAGTKTQTRRVVKDIAEGPGGWPSFMRGRHMGNMLKPKYCPYGQPGDRLWVRETFCHQADENDAILDDKFWYRASNPEVIRIDGDGFQEFNKDGTEKSPWLPSIHMPRKASRITLEVTAVRVERLQDICDGDAQAEGVDLDPEYLDRDIPYFVPSYQKLWESINGPGSWDANPWVWVVEFKRVTP